MPEKKLTYKEKLEQDKKEEEIRKRRLWVKIPFFFLNFLLLIVAGLVMLFTSKESFANKHNLLEIVAYVEIIYLVLSLKKVNIDEIGAILFFGQPEYEIPSGLFLVPFGFFSINKDSRLIIEDQYPGDPEIVDKTSSDTLAPGKVYPIRVTHAAPTGKPAGPLDVQMTTEVSISARYRIKRGSYLEFLETIGDMEKVRTAIRDTIESEVKKQFAARTASVTLGEQKEIEDKIRDSVVLLTDSWGIEVVTIQIVDIDLGKTVNERLRNVPAAKLAKEAKITDAEAEREKLILEGQGRADAEKTFRFAVAAGAKKLSEVTGTPEGQIALWIETLGEALKTSKHSIIPGGELFTSIAGLKEMVEKIGKEK